MEQQETSLKASSLSSLEVAAFITLHKTKVINKSKQDTDNRILKVVGLLIWPMYCSERGAIENAFASVKLDQDLPKRNTGFTEEHEFNLPILCQSDNDN